MQSISFIARKYNIKIVLTIFAIIVLHFVSQQIIFQEEIDVAKTEVVPTVETKVENEAKRTEVLTAPLPVVPIIQTEEDVEPVMTPIKIKKKKMPNETPAERLRNAEKILTGA